MVTTATDTDGQKGVGVKLEMGRRGDVVKKSVVARQVGAYLFDTSDASSSSIPSLSKINQ